MNIIDPALLENINLSVAEPTEEPSTPIQTVYPAGHPKAGERVIPNPKSLMIYDVKSLSISDYQELPSDMDFLVYKAVIINTIDAFMNQYVVALRGLVLASQMVTEKKMQGVEVLSGQMMMNIMGRVQEHIEKVQARLEVWDGSTPFLFMLPYSETAMTKDFQGQDIIDTKNSKPYVNGMYFLATWSK